MREAMTTSRPLEAVAPAMAQVLKLKYGHSERIGWGPPLRARFNYRTPDDWYEAYLFDKVTSETTWLDVGCGRSMFPHNRPVAKVLAERARLLFGADPSDNVDDNPFVHQRAKCEIQDLETDLRFDLITLRMVAEHIRDPRAAVDAFSRLAKPGALVVVYTVWKWAPVSIVSALTPMSVHHAVKRFLWTSNERDTFPVEYRMNTRTTLQRLFEGGGFREQDF
jgi:2-polyprenyl-3-methyl-5-hydroxy-6-metoxy-1,4-benzoquinol methylase